MGEIFAKKLVDQYRLEFGEKYGELQNYANQLFDNVQQRLQKFGNLQDIRPQLSQKWGDFVKSLQNTEMIPADTCEKLVQTFAWAGVMQAGIFLAAIISAYALHPIIGLTLGFFWSVMLAFLILPMLAYIHLISTTDDDRTVRFKLLAFAMAEGFLTGYLYSHLYLSSMQPLIFVTPIAFTAIAQQLLSFLGENASRANALSACLGVGFGLHLAIGLPLGQLSFAYLLLTLLYTAVAFCAIQLYMKYLVESPSANLDHLCMLGYVFSALLCQGLIFFLFGSAQQLEE